MDSWVHPRVCGEASSRMSSTARIMGPSPRVRGSHATRGPQSIGRGSIPACAGKPGSDARNDRVLRVHPRVCGEAPSTRTVAAPASGPSPRVRGSPRLRGSADARAGSIPACAGKPCRTLCVWSRSGVHPRVCGEATTPSGCINRGQGPSPRVRGSPAVGIRHESPRRFIVVGTLLVDPAGTGMNHHLGPSPRVRGSRITPVPSLLVSGSIPACAGKPDGAYLCVCRARVHPRVCGEARQRGCRT